jgi:hypothetical protein
MEIVMIVMEVMSRRIRDNVNQYLRVCCHEVIIDLKFKLRKKLVKVKLELIGKEISLFHEFIPYHRLFE